jgi:hypothetical protein
MKIIDKFTNLPVSRQRKYQLRKAAAGRCVICGDEALKPRSLCLEHLIVYRERHRKALGLKRRYLNSMSYTLAAGKPYRKPRRNNHT